jgi:peptidoglycan hydrolase CwlO-like protein
MDCAVAKVEQLEEKLKRNNCQKTVEKLGNRIEKRDAKIVKLQQRIKKLEESGADMLAQIDFG